MCGVEGVGNPDGQVEQRVDWIDLKIRVCGC
jgi:hypothetical protein